MFVLNGKTSATQNFKSGQIVAAVGVGTQAKKGISVDLKATLGVIGGLGALELIHSGFGFFTNFILGEYSIGRVVREAIVNKEELAGKFSNFFELFLELDNDVALSRIEIYNSTMGMNNNQLKQKILGILKDIKPICNTLAQKAEKFLTINVRCDNPKVNEDFKVRIIYSTNSITTVDSKGKGIFTLDGNGNVVLEIERVDKCNFKAILKNLK